MEQVNFREEVLMLLIDIDRKNIMSSQGLSNLLLRHQFAKKQDRAFMTRLFEGTLEQQIYLDYVLDGFSKKKMEKQKPFIRCLLRMSVYQILFMDQVPDSAACNEAVKLARKKGFSTLSGFVNGLLRNVVRQKDSLSYPDEKKEPLYYLSIRYSIPQWILEEWSKLYDYDRVKQMAEGSIRNARTTVRVNLSKASVEEVVASLSEEGVKAEVSSQLPYMIEISEYDSLSRIKAFRQGLIQVQDISSAMVGQIGNPAGDALVLDICSAPGGKTLHAADILLAKKGSGKVIARDVSEYKTSLIEDNMDRCGFTNIETEVFDGTQLDDEMVEKADLVLCDVPCSGLGILARKNDIKYNVTKERICELVPLQRQILKNAMAYVKPGGMLVFSTCTITKEENADNRSWILESGEFEPVDFSDRLPEWYAEEAKTGQLQLLPGFYGTDGFYMAKFRKTVQEDK